MGIAHRQTQFATALAININSVSAANPAVVTTASAHGYTSGQNVSIAGTTTTPAITGTQVCTVTGASTFTVPVNVTSGQAGAAGTVIPLHIAVGLTGANTMLAGSAALCTLMFSNPSGSIGTISQGGGDTVVSRITQSDGNVGFTAHYSNNSIAGGDTTYLFSWPNSGNPVALFVTEITGQAPTLTFDVGETANGPSSGGLLTHGTGPYSANLVVDATTNTKVTAPADAVTVAYTFVAGDVGKWLHVTAGAGWTPGYYQILSVAAGAATLSSSPAATGTTGGTWVLGTASLAQANNFVYAMFNADGSGSTSGVSVDSGFTIPTNGNKLGTGINGIRGLVAWNITTANTPGPSCTLTSSSLLAHGLIAVYKELIPGTPAQIIISTL